MTGMLPVFFLVCGLNLKCIGDIWLEIPNGEVSEEEDFIVAKIVNYKLGTVTK